MQNWPTYTDLVCAYKKCRLGKRASRDQIKFETELPKNLLHLLREIQQHKYQPLPSKCFVVTKPKPREIFAARFRDRIIHHLVVSRLETIWNKRFSPHSFACRRGKGPHKTFQELGRIINRLSLGGRHEVFALHLDIRSFFVSIDRSILLGLIKKDSHDHGLKYLCEVVFSHDARENIEIFGKKSLRMIPEGKSWFSQEKNCGLPIGNLSSQFAANLYLTGLDEFIQRSLRPDAYLRYMDDLLLLSRNPESLRPFEEKIDLWLKTNRKLMLNRAKTKFVSLRRVALKYLGYWIKQEKAPFHGIVVFVPPKKKWELISALDISDVEYLKNNVLLRNFISSINSRLGHIKHAKTYDFRKKTLTQFVEAKDSFATKNNFLSLKSNKGEIINLSPSSTSGDPTPA